jgi:hypothetical protein
MKYVILLWRYLIILDAIACYAIQRFHCFHQTPLKPLKPLKPLPIKQSQPLHIDGLPTKAGIVQCVDGLVQCVDGTLSLRIGSQRNKAPAPLEGNSTWSYLEAPKELVDFCLCGPMGKVGDLDTKVGR